MSGLDEVSEMLSSSLCLASSLCMLVDRRVVIGLHLLSISSTPELLRLLALLVDARNIRKDCGH
jgi:hypothetical protein